MQPRPALTRLQPNRCIVRLRAGCGSARCRQRGYQIAARRSGPRRRKQGPQMRPRYIVLGLALVATAALALMDPLRGRSIEEMLNDLAGTLTAALSGSTGPASPATNAALTPPEITVSQPAVRKTIEWDEYTG